MSGETGKLRLKFGVHLGAKTTVGAIGALVTENASKCEILEQS